jgi:hypothetical protein
MGESMRRWLAIFQGVLPGVGSAQECLCVFVLVRCYRVRNNLPHEVRVLTARHLQKTFFPHENLGNDLKKGNDNVNIVTYSGDHCLHQWCESGMFIPDPNFFPSRIPEFNYFNQKIVSKLSEIWSGMFIPDPDPPGSDLGFYLSRIQRSKRLRIPDPDPQHWSTTKRREHIFTKNFLVKNVSFILFEDPLLFLAFSQHNFDF